MLPRTLRKDRLNGWTLSFRAISATIMLGEQIEMRIAPISVNKAISRKHGSSVETDSLVKLCLCL